MRPRSAARRALAFVFVLAGMAGAAGACTGATLEELLVGKQCDAAGQCAPGYECELGTRLCVPTGTVHTGGAGGGGTGGTGGSDACDDVADCGAPPACQLWICINHVCATLAAGAGPLPSGQQDAGDCKILLCDGLGNVDTQNDDTDLPVDGLECTDDTCVAGVPANPPTGLGTPCSAGGGRTCDGTGQCVACVAAADCTDITPTECRDRGCVAGACQPTFTTSGTVLAIQNAGDCQRAVCDGAGSTTTQADDLDLPFDDNPCTADVCTGGVATNPPEQVGVGCGGVLTCDGAGHCLGCTLPTDCPGTDTYCQQRICESGQCGFSYTVDGTVLPSGGQTPGDCQSAHCNGAGGLDFDALDSDLPPDDGLSCTLEACNAGAPMHPPAPVGTACSEAGGTVCDGAGSCVACNAPADCANQGTVCQSATCTAHVCGLQNAVSGTPAPAGSQAPGDCKVVVCDGQGGTTQQADTNDLPVDGNECTADTCTGSTPSNPPLGQGTACAGTGTCDGAGSCSVKGPNGSPCTVGSQCTSNNCVDGVCCGSTCTGTCRACSQDKTGATDGTCADIPVGQDPDVECAPPQTCDGDAGCAFSCGQQPSPPAGSCPAACTGGCSSGTCIIDCNDSGQCSSQTLACPPGFACEVQCGGSQACDGATIDCPDLYACQVLCTGSCANAIVACGSGTCDLACGGNRCAGAVVTCGQNRCTASCQGGTSFPSVTCGGSCDCGSCQHALGTSCAQGTECQSGSCVDGVCCDAACAGLCEACDLGGSTGTCTAVPAGQDPKSECTGSATCDGNRTCSLKALGDSCNQAAQCQSGACAENVCCNSACAQLCQSCLGAYNGGLGDGTCGSIDAGLDPYHECSGPRTCTGSGTCSN
ncbi:MAG: hypothetical protein HY908_32565 [Myxococcales bacterium]|nr:hypothetical protein [Myxococcales bacterium]